ncbi:MAG: inositol monophosphatase family protein, partial [Gammaproteobacteria bacterium]
LDGVANFQAGIPVWGMSLALLENFWQVFGAFFMPVTGDIFHAQAGKEAFWGNRRIMTGQSAEINNESVLLTYARFHNHYACKFPGKVRSLGCTAAHICYVAAGRAEAAVLTGETYQNLAATRVITEAAGIRLYRMDGSEFFLNEYLDGSRIGETLLAVSPDNLQNIQDCLKTASL